MRHRAHGRKLGRTTAHRKALFRNQLTALINHERITTTVAKAKELRPLAEKMVTLARTGTLANRRRVLETLPDREVVRRLFDDIAPRFANRPGGYTRIVRVGRRHGDNAELAIVEFIDYEPKFDEEAGAKGKGSLMDRAKGMFGGRRAEAEAEEAEIDQIAAEDEVGEDQAADVADEPPEPVEAKDEVAEPDADAEPAGEADVEEPADAEAAEDEEKPKKS